MQPPPRSLAPRPPAACKHPKDVELSNVLRLFIYGTITSSPSPPRSTPVARPRPACRTFIGSCTRDEMTTRRSY
eukprot:365644-Chlamydomonas_euryale.AAC.11